MGMPLQNAGHDRIAARVAAPTAVFLPSSLGTNMAATPGLGPPCEANVFIWCQDRYLGDKPPLNR